MSTLSLEDDRVDEVASFSIGRARAIVGDLFEHQARIYWTDMLVSLTIGYGFAISYLTAPDFSLQQIASLFIASFALFRVGSFIHEIVHFREGELTGFTVGWNLLAGIPMLMPSFFYDNHIDHHNTQHYGTGQDGEYLPLGSTSLGHIFTFFLQLVFLPAWIVFRFLILTPVSFLHPKLRQWVLERASYFGINPQYRRRSLPTGKIRTYWALTDITCFLRAAGIFVLLFAGGAEWTRLPKLYIIAMCVLGLNYIRNLVAHRYESEGNAMSHVEQLRDSVNITGVPILTELFFPLNLRFHALHHLFPRLPYHNLRTAHNRLLRELPEESDYHKSVYPGYFCVANEILRKAWDRTDERRERSAGWFSRRREHYRQRAQQRNEAEKQPLAQTPS